MRVAVFFSGPQDDGLVRILRGAGIEVDPFDILQDREGQDLTKNSVLNPVLHRIASDYYDFVFIATPCCSFSILKAMRTLLDPEMSNEELTDRLRACLLQEAQSSVRRLLGYDRLFRSQGRHSLRRREPCSTS